MKKSKDNMDLLIEAIEQTKNEYQWKTVDALLEDYELRRRGELLLVDVDDLHDMFEAFTLQVSENYRELQVKELEENSQK